MMENARAWLIDFHKVDQKVMVYLATAVYSTSFKPDCPKGTAAKIVAGRGLWYKTPRITA